MSEKPLVQNIDMMSIISYSATAKEKASFFLTNSMGKSFKLECPAF